MVGRLLGAERVGRGTYTAEVFVQELHISVDQLQRDELIVLALDGAAEVEAGISVDRGTGGVAGGPAGPGFLFSNLLFPLIPSSGSVSLLDIGRVAPGYANSNSLGLMAVLTNTGKDRHTHAFPLAL